jgi:hypothetical protein
MDSIFSYFSESWARLGVLAAHKQANSVNVV